MREIGVGERERERVVSYVVVDVANWRAGSLCHAQERERSRGGGERESESERAEQRGRGTYTHSDCSSRCLSV